MDKNAYQTICAALEQIAQHTPLPASDFHEKRTLEGIRAFLKNLRETPGEQVWWIRQQDESRYSGLTRLVSQPCVRAAAYFGTRASAQRLLPHFLSKPLNTFALSEDDLSEIDLVLFTACSPHITSHEWWPRLLASEALIIGYLKVNGPLGAPQGGHFAGGHPHPQQIPFVDASGNGAHNGVHYCTIQALAKRFSLSERQVRQALNGTAHRSEGLSVMHGEYRHVSVYSLPQAAEIIRGRLLPQLQASSDGYKKLIRALTSKS